MMANWVFAGLSYTGLWLMWMAMEKYPSQIGINFDLYSPLFGAAFIVLLIGGRNLAGPYVGRVWNRLTPIKNPTVIENELVRIVSFTIGGTGILCAVNIVHMPQALNFMAYIAFCGALFTAVSYPLAKRRMQRNVASAQRSPDVEASEALSPSAVKTFPLHNALHFCIAATVFGGLLAGGVIIIVLAKYGTLDNIISAEANIALQVWQHWLLSLISFAGAVHCGNFVTRKFKPARLIFMPYSAVSTAIGMFVFLAAILLLTSPFIFPADLEELSPYALSLLLCVGAAFFSGLYYQATYRAPQEDIDTVFA